MAEIEFELFNNQLVQQLVGPQDGNLKIIEKALGAEIAAFGNRIRISGDEEAVRQPRQNRINPGNGCYCSKRKPEPALLQIRGVFRQHQNCRKRERT